MEATPGGYHPDVDKYAKRISGRVEYPIENFQQFLEALGGEDTPIEFRGSSVPAREMDKFLPERFFPIESEEDLVNKGEDLRVWYSYDGDKVAPQAEEDIPAELREAVALYRELDPGSLAPPPTANANVGVIQLPRRSTGGETR